MFKVKLFFFFELRIFERVTLYLLLFILIKSSFVKCSKDLNIHIYTGLYREDGLVVLSYINARGIDKIRKIIIKMFKDIGFQLEIKTNLKQVELLEVTFN